VKGAGSGAGKKPSFPAGARQRVLVPIESGAPAAMIIELPDGSQAEAPDGTWGKRISSGRSLGLTRQWAKADRLPEGPQAKPHSMPAAQGGPTPQAPGEPEQISGARREFLLPAHGVSCAEAVKYGLGPAGQPWEALGQTQ